MGSPRVGFVTAVVTHYREPFHQRLYASLAQAGVAYNLFYSSPRQEEAAKRDTVEIGWAMKVPVRAFARRNFVFQSLPEFRELDMIILGQENRFLHNYLLQILPKSLRPRVALFGHGRNFQARDPNSRSERWKRFWATKADWWFAYTDETRRHVESLGFPPERITVFNNSVDTGELRRLAAAVTPARQAERRRELGLAGGNVAIFVGGLYADKRLAFLVEAAAKVRARVPDFELIVAGGGTELERLRALAAPYAWIKVVGPRFGADKVELMSLARLFLMPGLVGLAILDAAVMGLPTITTAFPWHSPEIAYLEPDVNGVKVAAWEDADAYAAAVVELLEDSARLARMATAARAMADRFTIEAMAERFAEGVLKALA